jgi:hypothetical protein
MLRMQVTSNEAGQENVALAHDSDQVSSAPHQVLAFPNHLGTSPVGDLESAGEVPIADGDERSRVFGHVAPAVFGIIWVLLCEGHGPNVDEAAHGLDTLRVDMGADAATVDLFEDEQTVEPKIVVSLGSNVEDV